MNDLIMWTDTETGGFNPKQNPCLSIGYVITEGPNFEILKKREVLLKNKYDLFCTRRALEVNKIDIKEHNKNALDPKDAIEIVEGDIKKYFKKKKPFLAGHNLVAFDLPYLKDVWDREGEVFESNYKNFDTLHFIRGLILLGKITPKSASMNNLVPYFNLESEHQHSALVDSMNLILMMKKLKRLRLLKIN